MDDMTKAYLEAIDKMTQGRSIESAVLRHGQGFALPDKPRPRGIAKMKAHQCFRNAFILAEKLGAQYVEGFAHNDLVPLQHAWVVMDGVLIDPTWKTLGKAYFGIVIPRQTHNKIVVEMGMYGALDPMSKTFRQTYWMKGAW